MRRIILALVLFLGLAVSANYLSIATDKQVPGTKTKRVLGKNPDIDIAASETINSNGGTLTFPTTANKLVVVSSSANDVGGVQATGSITVVDWTEMLDQKASGTYTVNTNALAAINGITLDLNGEELEAGVDFTVNGTQSAATIAANIAAAINADNNLNTSVIATSIRNIVTVTYLQNGQVGNAFTIASDGGGITASAATLTGGTDLLTLSVNGIDLVAGVDFIPSTSNGVTATNIATAINANGTIASDLSASATGAVITLTALAEGTAGNAIALATDNTNGATVSGANLAGGRADGTGANEVTIECLNANYLEVTETVILNGTNNVKTTNECIRLNGFEVAEAGSGGVSAGAVKVTQNGSNLFLGKILTGTNQAELGYFTVPTKRQGLLVDLTGSVYSGSGKLQVITKAREAGSVFKEVRLDTLTENGSNFIPATNLPIRFAPRTDVVFEGKADADNTAVYINAGLVITE